MTRRRTLDGIVTVAVILCAGIGVAGAQDRLVEAIKANDVAAVRTLLDTRVDVNAAKPDGTTALHWAVDRDSPEIVQLLIRAGANVKAANRYGATPLWLAALNGNAATIGMLLEAGASASAASPEGETALMVAARTGKVDAVNALLARGADPNVAEKVARPDGADVGRCRRTCSGHRGARRARS